MNASEKEARRNTRYAIRQCAIAVLDSDPMDPDSIAHAFYDLRDRVEEMDGTMQKRGLAWAQLQHIRVGLFEEFDDAFDRELDLIATELQFVN